MNQVMIIFKRMGAFLVNRLVVMAVIFGVMFYILFNRLFELQIIQGEKLENEFKLLMIKERTLEGPRGNIYDRNGYPLAENAIAFNVMLDGSIQVENVNQMIYDLVSTIETSGDQIISTLPITINEDGNLIYTANDSQILRFKKTVFLNNSSDALADEEQNMNAMDMFVYLRDELFKIPTETYTDQDVLNILNVRYPLWLNRYTQYRLETIAINISDTTLARIEENIEKFPGVSIVEDPLRVYNDAPYFAHIIGYTGKIDSDTLVTLEPLGYDAEDIVGKIGIEQNMETYLRGVDGKQTVEVDNLGRTMDIIETVNPTVGKDVYLTIDHDLQIQAYNILEKKLADLLQSTLAYKGYVGTDKDDEVTLMKDLFSSLFNNNVISVSELTASTEDQSQRLIYDRFLTSYNDVVSDITTALNDTTYYPLEEDLRYYEYLLSKLHEEGYLKDGYSTIDTYKVQYDQMMERKLSFKALLEIYCNTSMIQLSNDADPNVSTYDHVNNHILGDVLNYDSFKKIIYVKLAEEERFSYSLLCLTLIEQGAVTATDTQIQDLKIGRLDSITFMKEKITNLEITPQQIALDPCSGSVVLTDVNSGEVLALVSYPSYDNNRLVNNFDYEYYSELLNDPTTPLFPMATQGKTAPGSTFKMVSAVAGIEEGVVGLHEHITDLGVFQKITPSAKCWIYGSYGSTHGSVEISSALEVSCNYFYYEVGYRLSKTENGTYVDVKGVETLQRYAQLLGLGKKTGIEIGEAEASLPMSDAVRSAIGQTSNSYTPVQLSRYVATIANGGSSYELNLIDKVMENNGEVYFDKVPAKDLGYTFKEDTMSVVQEGMYLVTEGPRGTARSPFKNFPIIVAGKTGTAQQSKTRPDHGLFVGYAPFDNPEISVVTMIPFGYGSTAATYVARDTIAAYYQIYNAETDTVTVDNMLDE